MLVFGWGTGDDFLKYDASGRVSLPVCLVSATLVPDIQAMKAFVPQE
jgi:hypothetical protein